jgi:beta-catenin-like protein 1
MEFRPEVVGDVAKQGLLAWLLKRLRVKAPFDANKLYVSEILSILLQNSPENKTLLGTMDGIDVLLQQLAVGGLIFRFVIFSVQYSFNNLTI